MVSPRKIRKFRLIRPSLLGGQRSGANQTGDGGNRRIEVACNDERVSGRHSLDAAG